MRRGPPPRRRGCLPHARHLGERVKEFERGFGSATRLTSFTEVDEVFRSRDFAQGSHIDGHPSAALFNGTVLTLSGNDHFQRRRLEAQLLRRAALARFENELLPTALDRRFALIRRARGPDNVAGGDLLEIVRSALLPMAAAIVGLDGVEADDSVERLRLLLLRLSDGSSARWSALPLDEVVTAATEAKVAFVTDYFHPAWRRRESLLAAVEAGDLARSELPTDLITLLMANPISGEDEDLNVREVLVFFTGAANTPALVTPFVVRDILDWFADHPEDRSANRPELEAFLWRALQESLRLHLEVPAHFRVASRPAVLSTGRKVR